MAFLSSMHVTTGTRYAELIESHFGSPKSTAIIMYSEGQMTLALMHDLALLYLGLAHGADENLDPAETRQISASLRRWQPDKDPALIDHVIREATLSYLNGAKLDRLREAIHVLRNALSDDLRRTILRDLSEIARADGEILSEERDFIQKIADEWDLEHPFV
jgi:uncharacterized tellurite resistance protein B-like protein